MESASQSKPVMDVKAPTKPVVALPPTPPKPAASVSAPAPVGPQPAVPASVAAPMPKPPTLSPKPPGVGTKQSEPLPLHKAPEEEQASSQNQTVNPPEVPKAQPKIKKQKTSQGITAAIVLTLVVMVALSTLAVYMYTQS